MSTTASVTHGVPSLEVTHDHSHDHQPLATNQDKGSDPTDTEWVEEEYGKRLRNQLRKLNAVIRSGLVSDDVLQIQAQNAPSDPQEQETYDFPTDEAKVAAFMDWFRRQLQRGFLSVVDPSDNMFIRMAYERGVEDARERLEVDPPEPNFELPVHREALKTLRTRSYELLQGVTDDMASQVHDELSEGLRDGHHSSDIARSITDRVDKVGKNRASLISRTEVINSYTDATLNQYKSVGIEGVTIESEVLTAQDERVCPICEAIAEMGVFSLQDIENRNVTGDALKEVSSQAAEIPGAKVFRLKPPIHPRCRCTLLPVRN